MSANSIGYGSPVSSFLPVVVMLVHLTLFPLVSQEQRQRKYEYCTPPRYGVLYILFTTKAILQCGNGGTAILWFMELRPQHIFGCHTGRGISLCEPQSVPFLQGLLGPKPVFLSLPVGPKVCLNIWYNFSF